MHAAHGLKPSRHPTFAHRNGVWQGKAYEDIPEGTYYPALSLYTLPHQREGATLTANFGTYPMRCHVQRCCVAHSIPCNNHGARLAVYTGPSFDFAPPTLDGVPTAAPMCDAAGSQGTAGQAEGVEGPAVEPMAVDGQT